MNTEKIMSILIYQIDMSIPYRRVKMKRLTILLILVVLFIVGMQSSDTLPTNTDTSLGEVNAVRVWAWYRDPPQTHGYDRHRLQISFKDVDSNTVGTILINDCQWSLFDRVCTDKVYNWPRGATVVTVSFLTGGPNCVDNGNCAARFWFLRGRAALPITIK